MAEVEIGDALDVVGKIPWRQTMQAILSDKIVLITSTRTPRTHMASAKSLLDRSRPMSCVLTNVALPNQLSANIDNSRPLTTQ